jgi:hypothetical protein
MLKHLCRICILKNDHAIPALIKSAFYNLIQNHLTELLKNLFHRETNALCYVVYLHLRVWL